MQTLQGDVECAIGSEGTEGAQLGSARKILSSLLPVIDRNHSYVSKLGIGLYE